MSNAETNSTVCHDSGNATHISRPERPSHAIEPAPMIAAESKPSLTANGLVMYITTDRPWNERRISTLFRRQDSRKRSLYAYYTMESAKSETMPDPLSEWDPSAMISLKNEFLEQDTTEFHKLYEEKSRKTSYAESCLKSAVNSARTTFRDDPRMEDVSVESRIEPNPNITDDELRHGRCYTGLIPIYGV